MADINWREIEDAAVAQLVSAVREVRDEQPDETIYAAVFNEFYGDGTVTRWPMLAVGTEETLAEMVDDARERNGDSDDLEREYRWSGPDIAYQFEPDEAMDEIADSVQEVAGESGDFDDWEPIYDRFTERFPAAATRAREQLIAEGLVGEEFLALAMDEAEELVPLSLTKEQLQQHFPYLADDDE